ncbi:MAG: DUF350 domain-containing protein [Chloroflexi bacterium]|nr:DUF350 domain-containing protein [Chloroflexota bacterium]
MGDAFVNALELFPRGLVYVGMGLVILVLAKLAQDLVTPYKIGEQLSHKDNVALAVSITGYYLGIVIVFLGALYEPIGSAAVVDGLGFTREYWEDVLSVAIYSLAGIVVLNVARILVDRFVLYKFSTEKEIITDQNAGTGAVEFGVFVAVSLVIAGSISGTDGGPDTALAFGGLGLLVIVLYTFFYDLTTPYDLHEQIENDNVAVGVALGGNLIAIGIVAFKAVFGEFVSWEAGLAEFVTFAVIGFALLYVVRRIVDLVLFPGVKVSDELAVDRNLGVAFIMAGSVISVSLILFFAV